MINTALLSVESSPPFLVPYRYILTAPLFGLLFACTLLLLGDDVYGSRWNPALIGLLHLLNLGLFTMVVSGLLFQLLPVAGGVQFPKVTLLASYFHLMLVLGTLSFFVGFLVTDPLLLQLSAGILVAGFVPYLLLLMVAVYRPQGRSGLVRQLKYIVPFPLLLVALGILLLTGWGSDEIGLKREWTDIHAVWALGGWFTLLLIAISFQLIPMFQVTPDFHPLLKQWGVPLISLSLLVWGGGTMAGMGHWVDGGLWLAAAGMVLFGGSGLWVLSKRKRKIWDASVLFWQISLSSLTIGSLWILTVQTTGEGVSSLLGLYWLFVVLLPMVCGMLLKIAPFLVYIHLQQRVLGDPSQFGRLSSLPHQFQILPARWGRLLLLIYITMMVAAILSLFHHALRPLMVVLLLLFFAWLGWIVLRCYRVFHQHTLN